MRVLIRILLLAGILCLSMNFVGVVISYYSTVRELSQGSDASVDALTNRAANLQRDPWPTYAWTIMGIVLIAAALVLWVTRQRKRPKRSDAHALEARRR